MKKQTLMLDISGMLRVPVSELEESTAAIAERARGNGYYRDAGSVLDRLLNSQRTADNQHRFRLSATMAASDSGRLSVSLISLAFC